MELLDNQLFVKKSTIPAAGKGLFTKKAIPKGVRITEYRGKITAWEKVKNDDHNPYIFYVTRNHVISALDDLTVLARYANDARGLSRITGITNNCEYVIKGKQAFITSKKAIPAGSELLVGYGKEYWDVIRHNIKVK